MGRVKKHGALHQIVEPKKTRRSAQSKEDSWRWWYLWAALVGFIAVLVMLTFSITLFSRNSTETSTTTLHARPPEVAVRLLSSPDQPFARSCAQGREPVVLKNSVVKKWQAKRNWSPDYLRSKLKTLQGIYENDNRWFGPYFDRSKPLLEHAVHKNIYRTDLVLAAEEFFHRLENPVQHRYHYFTGDIDQLGEWAYAEIQPIKELLTLNPKRSSVNTWMGQPHVIAHCHYDGYHNFYAQLYGTKKFKLFRPTEWPGLYPYPFLHPSHAQAQVNATDEGDVRKFPLVERTKALEVVLEPGDLLYMPPLWFHEVESLSVSISVNVWTDSHQTELMEKVFAHPLPLDPDRREPSHGHEHAQWNSVHVRRIGAAVLIFRLLEQVCRYQSCTSPEADKFSYPSGDHHKELTNRYAYFIHQLWGARYKFLMESGEIPNTFLNEEPVLCEAMDDASAAQLVMSADSSVSKDVHFSIYLEQVSQLVRGLPADTWQLWMGNYVEYVAANALGDVQYVGYFLKHFNSCTKTLR